METPSKPPPSVREPLQQPESTADSSPQAHVSPNRDPLEELLLGPALAIPKVLERTGLTLDRMDVIELHEAFAGQVLAVIELLGQDAFARERLGRDRAVGSVDLDKTNLWGGSLSIGHPFGATGGRLVATCCRRLEHEGGRYGIVAACASGALGYAIVLERSAS